MDAVQAQHVVKATVAGEWPADKLAGIEISYVDLLTLGLFTRDLIDEAEIIITNPATQEFIRIGNFTAAHVTQVSPTLGSIVHLQPGETATLALADQNLAE